MNEQYANFKEQWHQLNAGPIMRKASWYLLHDLISGRTLHNCGFSPIKSTQKLTHGYSKWSGLYRACNELKYILLGLDRAEKNNITELLPDYAKVKQLIESSGISRTTIFGRIVAINEELLADQK